MDLRSQIARHAATGERIERSLAQRLEFITANPDDRNAVVGADQRTLHNQFELANVMKPERPRNSQLDIALFQKLLIDFKTNGFAAQITGSAGSDVSHSPEPIRETQL